jgi:hypothetical protein
VAGAGGLTAIIAGNANTSVLNNVLLDPAATAGVLGEAAVGVNITVPLYQPANLVAMHSLTSTYRAASFEEANESATTNGVASQTPGPIQLPRAATGDPAPRLLRTAGGTPAVAPFGYTGRMRVFIDVNNNGAWDDGNGNNGSGSGTVEEPYREFEVWFGVPVDLNLKQNESVVDLRSLQHGFGIENGLLGYDPAAPGNPGLLPPPLFNTNVGPGNTNTFGDFFKVFTVQNRGNVNAMNLRASQRVSNNADGSAYVYYGLRSDTVDKRFGILAAGADPLVGGTAAMPQIVTSLDRIYDAELNTQLQTPGSIFNPSAANPGYLVPFQVTLPDGTTVNTNRYQAFYANLGGAHTLHKPRTGSVNPTVLSIPDVPSTALPPTLGPNGELLPPPVAEPTRVAVAVPLGTPAGTYTSNAGSTPFAIFEDHDTQAPDYYLGVPTTGGPGDPATGNWLKPAGPLYAGQNYVHFKRLGAATPIFPASGEGILRPRQLVSGNRLEYLPYTDPTMRLVVRVTEAGLTGQVGDQALTTGTIGPAIVTGTLPGIDPFPFFDNAVPATPRAASALTPAAFRSANTGNLFVFFSRQYTTDGLAQAQPGAPYKLYTSALAWNGDRGFWQAYNYGSPKDAGSVYLTNNRSAWFTPPTEVTGPVAAAAATESNVAPFVLYDPILMDPTVAAPGQAAVPTLFWVNTVPVAGGQPVTQILRATVDEATGTVGAPVPLINAGAIDPSVRRYGPRAAYVPNGTTLVFYYGGTGNSATLSLLYGALNAGANGAVTGTINRERSLTVPLALASATEPTAVVRSFPVDQARFPQRYANEEANTPQKAWVTSNPYVVDVYFSGVSRANRNPDLYQMRFRVRGSGTGAALSPVDLPRVEDEELAADGREAVYRSTHIAWYRNPGAPTTGLLDKRPVVTIFQRGLATPVTVGPNNWRYDPATQFLFQRTAINGKETVVYLDTSAGVVRFRGPGAPSPAVPNTVVRASYTPQAYRVTPDPVADSAPLAFADRIPVASGNADVVGQGNFVGRPVAGNPGGNDVSFQANPFVSGLADIMSRQWLFWQKGAQSGRPAAVYYTTRRVGFDLRALGLLNPNETIALTQPGADPAGRNNQYPLIQATVNGAKIPLEVDFAKGRAYTEGILEGEIAVVTGQKAKANDAAGPAQIPVNAQVRLQLIDEYVNAPSENGTAALSTTAAVGAPVTRAVNEGQPYPFLDPYNAYVEGQALRTFTRVNDQPGVIDPVTGGYADPQLVPGRVWLFWASSRGRTGLLRNGAGQTVNLSGYDLFWETLAPQFGTPSVSLFPQP